VQYVLSAKSGFKSRNISEVVYDVCDSENFTIFSNFEKLSSHHGALTTITKNKIFIKTKIPPPHEKGEGNGEGLADG
jgi:hypothetical protein